MGCAQVPTGPVPVPDVVAGLAGSARVTPVWRNELGGVTFRLDGARTRYVKWSTAIDLTAEARRLVWARRWVRVPKLLARGRDGTWLLTEAIDGRSAVDPRWCAEPVAAAFAIGRALRMLHDALPVAGCPFDWGVAHRLAVAGVGAGIGESPPIDRLVVCHGDACAPNTLLREEGVPAGHVDLGSLGLADRWADLAVAAWSTEWNYGPGYEETVYRGYGVAPDAERIAYYRRLWELT